MKAAEYARTMNTMATVVGCPVEGVRESMHFAVADWATVEMAADKGEGAEGLRLRVQKCLSPLRSVPPPGQSHISFSSLSI